MSTVYEKRFWNRNYLGGRVVCALGINLKTGELQVRHMKFWRGQLQKTVTLPVSEFFERTKSEGPKRNLQQLLRQLPSREGFEPARNSL
jgi:hypothetical protein